MKNILMAVSVALIIAAGATEAGIKRSSKARVDFIAHNPCPGTGATKLPCKGYVIDHIIPLACDGPDDPSNMMWQTVADGKAKDRWERKNCGVWYKPCTSNK